MVGRRLPARHNKTGEVKRERSVGMTPETA